MLVNAPHEGECDSQEDDPSVPSPPPQQSSVVRMAAIRVASGSKRKELGSTRALTPVRRAMRLAKDVEPELSTTDMLMQNGYSYMPNPSLCGAHFAPEIPAMASDDEVSSSGEAQIDSCSESDDEKPADANMSNRDDCGKIMEKVNAAAFIKLLTAPNQEYTPFDLASNEVSSREPTPMLPRKFAGSSMPPRVAATNQLGSAFVYNGVTPVRRSTRLQELTPTPLRRRWKICSASEEIC